MNTMECRKIRTKNYKKCFFCSKKKMFFQDCSFCDGCDLKEYKTITPLRKKGSSKRTKAVSINTKTKEQVFARDGGKCIFCGAPGNPEMHVVPRSAGGLGTEENIVCGCRLCHAKMDQSSQRSEMIEFAKNYLKKFYTEEELENVVYKKIKVVMV